MKKLLTLLLLTLGLTACGKPVDIKGNEYQLTNAPENAEITLAFSGDDNRYFGKVVNRYFGTYTIEGDKLTFGPTASTMMMGPEPLMKAEQQYFQELAMTQGFKATDTELTLTLAGNKTLVFKKIGTVPAK